MGKVVHPCKVTINSNCRVLGYEQALGSSNSSWRVSVLLALVSCHSNDLMFIMFLSLNQLKYSGGWVRLIKFAR